MTPREESVLLAAGGKKLQVDDVRRLYGAAATHDVWDFGYLQPGRRSAEQEAAHAAIVTRLPRFEISGVKTDDPKRVQLFDFWKAPEVVAGIGKAFPGFHQFTGSCVGAGGGNTVMSLMCVEICRLKQPEQAHLLHYPYTYGRSRFYLGDRGRGEGSTGGAYVEAITKDGSLDTAEEGLEKPTLDDGVCFGAGVEMKWSDGFSIEDKWIQLGKKHMVKTCAPCKSSDDVREAIRNGYPCSWCGDWGGQMQCPTDGEPKVLLNRHAGSWSHQQSCHAWWDHPTLGEIYWIQNQWGLTVHGSDPAGGPGGGYWVKKGEIDYQCRGGEVYAFSQYEGFPAQDVSWYL